LERVGEIEFHFENEDSNPELTMAAFILDGIKVAVIGSMYDDRQ
jgi:hypothetical protein